MDYIDDEKETVEEALNRGASESVLVAWLARKRKYGVPFTDADPVDLRIMIQPEVVAYRNKVTAEFNSLKIDFRDPLGQNEPALNHYFAMRPLYYRVGFNNPCRDIFLKIKDPYYFLEKRVPGGVHQAFVPGLDMVASILRRVPGLYERIRGSITRQDAGFTPRPIAGSDKLSNHAFGLAIDIDPGSNPHIVKPQVIPLLNEVVRRKAGLNYDFSGRFVDHKVWSDVVNDRERLIATYLAGQTASKAVQQWLSEWLGMYKYHLGDIARGQAKEAQQAIDANRDLKLIQLVNQFVPLQASPGEMSLENWEKTGIQSIPFELVAALKTAFGWNPQFRWGGEYETSKDMMHFELQAVTEKGGSLTPGAVTPDVQTVRELDEIIPLAIQVTADSLLTTMPPLTTSTPTIRMPK